MNENATITAMFDLDGKSAAELLQLDAMLSQEDGNDEACDMIHDYIDAHARALYERAVAAGDIAAGAILEEVLEYADPEYYAELCDQAEAEEEEDEKAAAEQDLDVIDVSDPAADAVQAYLSATDSAPYRQTIFDAAHDVLQDGRNLFKAGAFEGAATMLAAHMEAIGANNGASRAELKRAIYDLCYVAY